METSKPSLENQSKEVPLEIFSEGETICFGVDKEPLRVPPEEQSK